MSPPPIHDSDRKAAEEIRRSIPPLMSDDVFVRGAEEIIARHHAEERAAVEKVEKAASLFLFPRIAADFEEKQAHRGKLIESLAALSAAKREYVSHE